jgi:WD40 repeat protein
MRRGLLVLATLLAAGLTASGQSLLVKIPAPGEVRLTTFATDGERVAATLENNQVVIWALPSGKEARVLEFGKERPERLLFTADGKELVAALASGKVEVRDASSGALVRTIETGAVTTTAVSSEGHRHPPRVRRRGGPISAMAVSRDGRWLATANADNPSVFLWDFVSGKKLHEFDAEFGGTEDLAFSPDGSQLASAHDNTNIYVWDTAAGRLKFKVSDLLMAPFAVCFTPDGKSIATGGADRAVHLIDARTGKVRQSFPAEKFPIVAIQVSPDGASAATVHVDARSFALPAPVMLWNLASGQVVKRIEFTDTRPNGGGYASDGRLLYATAKGTELSVWSVR